MNSQIKIPTHLARYKMRFTKSSRYVEVQEFIGGEIAFKQNKKCVWDSNVNQQCDNLKTD
jgi:hypothetical protein